MIGEAKLGDNSMMLAFLGACFGDSTGRLHVGVGSGPHLADNGKYAHKAFSQHHFAWPDEARLAQREIQRASHESDVYVCPYLMWADKRTPAAAVALRLVHTDIDHGQLDPEKVQQLPGAFAVSSGTPGNGHVYVPLAAALTAPQHRTLCKALGAYLGGGEKISANDLLRPPGTLNHKPAATGGLPAMVTWLVPPAGVLADPHTLAALLGVDLADTPTTATHAGVAQVDLSRHPRVRDALQKNTGDRSADTMRVVGACLNDGLTEAEMRWAVSTRADLVARLNERPDHDDDLLRCWRKAIDERQQRKADSSWADGAQHDDGRATDSDPEGMPRLWKATDLRPAQPPRWLAKGRLPRDAVSLLIGDEGIGKSLFWGWIVAAITRGKPLPEFGIPARPPATVILVCTEDDWSSTVRPRLEVAGADLNMVQVICTEDDGSGSPVFPRDCFLILETDPKPALVVVDAWLDTVPAGLSVRDPQQARQALHPWKEVATSTDAAVLLLCHTNRVASPNARDRYGATYALRQKARLTLYAQQDDEGYLLIGPEKANSTAEAPASRFAITSKAYFPATDEHDGTVPLLAYIGESDRTAREHVAASAEAGADEPGGNPAKLFVYDYLIRRGGEAPAVDVLKEGRKAGFGDQELKDARRRHRDPRIVSRKASWGDGWVWAIEYGPAEGGEGGEGGTQSGMPPAVPPTTPSGDERHLGESLPPTPAPPGAPTTHTPGFTARVQNIVARANAEHPIRCHDCGDAIPEHMRSARARGMCTRCTARAAANTGGSR